MNGAPRFSTALLLILLLASAPLTGCYGVQKAIKEADSGKTSKVSRAQPVLVRFILQTMGQKKTSSRRLKAIQALSRIPNPTTVNTLRLVLQQEPSLNLKRAAILGLASLSASQAIEELRAALKSESPEVRMAAAAALGRMGVKETRRDLLQALGDNSPRVRAAAVRALVVMDSKTALPRLLTALTDPSPKVQSAAQTSLVELGAKALPSLRKALEGDPPLLRKRVLQLLPQFQKRAYPLLLWAFVETRTRTEAQAALEKLSGDPLAWKELRRLMEVRDQKDTHKAILKGFQKAPKSYVLRGILGIWERLPPTTRKLAVEPMGALAGAAGKGGQEILLDAIRKTEDVSLQCFALISLGYTGKTALPLLTPYLKRARRPLMKASIRGISKLNMAGWKELSRFLRHVDEDIRVTAILAAGGVRHTEVSQALQQQLAHPAAKIRIAVARALGVQEDRSAIPGLRKLLKDPVSEVVLTAVQALIRLGDEQNINLYIAALKNGPYPPEPTYVRTLGMLGNAQTLPILRNLVLRYLRSHRRYLKKARRLWKTRWRKRRQGDTLVKVQEEVKLLLSKEESRSPGAICSFLEALQALNRLGDSATDVLRKNRYRHNQTFNPLLAPPMSCPWPPSLQVP